MFLKSIQHLSLENGVTSSDKIIVIVWLKHIFSSPEPLGSQGELIGWP